MFVIRIADLNIGIENKYDYIFKMSADYHTEDPADFMVSVSDEEIMAENRNKVYDKGYLESLAIYRKIAEKLPTMGGFLMHGIAADVNGCGIAFLAKSGVGKSTHAKLWKELLGNKMTIINGDKPIIRIIDGTPLAYGTPWAGKENIHTNTKTELKKICFIQRSEINECIPMKKNEVLERLINQIYIPRERSLLYSTLDHIGLLIEKCDFYLINCNTDISSAKIAYEVLEL